MPVNGSEMNITIDDFTRALRQHAPQFEVTLTPDSVAHLSDYYQLVGAWNARLNLVAPCAPEEFAVRHVLESLVALRFLPPNASAIDVGSGAGLPIIPCLVARHNLSETLIEATKKKATFLREALSKLGLSDRAQVCAERFEQTTAPAADFVTCRALERFTKILPKLVAWSPPASTLLLFGGPTLQEKIAQMRLNYTALLFPQSEQRFLFVVNRAQAI